MFTKEEKAFLLQLLDQTNVSGVVAKTTALISIILGAVKELDSRLAQVEH